MDNVQEVKEMEFGRPPSALELEISITYPPEFPIGSQVEDIQSPGIWEVKCIMWSDYFHTWVYSSGTSNVFIGQSDLRAK